MAASDIFRVFDFARSHTNVEAERSDGALLRLAHGRDEEACRELMHRHAHRLFTIVDAAHSDLGITEDIVQEAFIRAIDRAHELRSDESMFPWLVRIALRAAIDHRRKRKREWLTDSFNEQMPAPDNPEQQMSDLQDSLQIQRALKRLKPQVRELIVLRYFSNFSVRELGQVFDKSDAAIRKDLQRARDQLRGRLAGWFEKRALS